jgi:hypothetical protein
LPPLPVATRVAKVEKPAPTASVVKEKPTLKTVIDQLLHKVVIQSGRDIIEKRMTTDYLCNMFFPHNPREGVDFDDWVKTATFGDLMACVFHCRTRRVHSTVLESVRLPHDVLTRWFKVDEEKRLKEFDAWFATHPLDLAISVPTDAEIERVQREARRAEDERRAAEEKATRETKIAQKAARDAAKNAAGKGHKPGKGKRK